GLREPERAMCSRADLVVDERVGTELAAALSPRPLFRRAHERTAHAGSARRRLDVPSLEVRHAIGDAILRVGADRELCEPGRSSCLADRDQNLERFANETREVLCDLGRMLLLPLALRPQRLAHPQPAVSI